MNDLQKIGRHFQRISGWLFPLRLLVFWLLFFAAFRVWFIVFNQSKWVEKSASEIFKSLFAAFPLDGSTAGYAMGLPLIFWSIGLFLNSNQTLVWEKMARFFSSIVIALFALGLGANTFLYAEWDALLNNRALEYLHSPRALLDSMSTVFQMICVVLYVGLVWFWVKILRLLVFSRPFLPEKRAARWLRFLVAPLILATNFLLIRGSVGVMPVNESAVYFSSIQFANHAAVNPIWHFIHSLVEARATTNRFIFFEKNEAKRLVSTLFPVDSWRNSISPAESEIGNRKSEIKKNVVILMMESMTSQVFDEPKITPNLHRLAREGLFFSDIFGSGFRTDQGLVSVLSGYPAQPDQSILMLDDKAARLPSLPRFFSKKGYSSLFCYGGELTFANLGVFLHNQGFQKIVSETDFSAAEKTQKWGADDSTMLDRFAREIGQLREPFFASTLTLTLHAPFDVPGESGISSLETPEKFRRAARFADRAIGRFFEKAATEAWFENTIFVLVADHGHGMPGQIPLERADARRVPLLFFGKNLPPELRGRRVEKTGCQHDLAATLLGLLGSQSVDFQWSRNLFSADLKPFGYWSNEHSLGWKDAAGEHIFDFAAQKWTVGQPVGEAQAFLQVLYDDFLEK